MTPPPVPDVSALVDDFRAGAPLTASPDAIRPRKPESPGWRTLRPASRAHRPRLGQPAPSGLR